MLCTTFLILRLVLLSGKTTLDGPFIKTNFQFHCRSRNPKTEVSQMIYHYKEREQQSPWVASPVSLSVTTRQRGRGRFFVFRYHVK